MTKAPFSFSGIATSGMESIKESRCITHRTTHKIDLIWLIDPSIKASKMITFLEKKKT